MPLNLPESLTITGIFPWGGANGNPENTSDHDIKISGSSNQFTFSPSADIFIYQLIHCYLWTNRELFTL